MIKQEFILLLVIIFLNYLNMKNFNINNTNGEKLLKNEELLNLRGGTHECQNYFYEIK